MKKLFILFFALFLFDTTIAQTNIYLQKGDQQLSLGQAISRLQLSNIFGAPKSVSSFDDDEVFDGRIEMLQFDSVSVTTLNGAVLNFATRSKQTQVVVNNGVFSVRSGSPISCVVEQIHDYSILVQQHENYIILRFKIPNTDAYNEDSLSLEVDENGIIGEIAWSIAI